MCGPAFRRRLRVGLTPATVSLLVAGCGGPTVVPVDGVVTHKGKPVPAVVVNFEPDAGRPSWGKTDTNGRFVLSCFADKDGAVVGRHRVYVTIDHERVPPAELWPLLKKYGREATPLRIEVTKKASDLEITLD